MAEITEERVREIVKEEIVKVFPINIVIDVNGEIIAKAIGDELRKRTGKEFRL